MNNLESKLAEAKRYEETQNKRCYVIWSVPMNCYLTQTNMPMLGEWYTSDGIQHGPSARKTW